MVVQLPLHVPLEVNVVLVGFGKQSEGTRLEAEELKWFLEQSFPSHRPICQETEDQLAVEHDFSYTVLQVRILVLRLLFFSDLYVFLMHVLVSTSEKKNGKL